MSINPSQMQIFGHAVTTQMDDNSVKCFANQKDTLRHIKKLFISTENLSKHLTTHPILCIQMLFF